MSYALEIKKLHKVYDDDTYALKNVSFNVKKGEFFALLGPNGSGKTTSINIISGPTSKTSGEIKIFGLDIEKHREETKFSLGVVPQEISFDSFFTVNEVLRLQSGYYGIKVDKTQQEYIDDILENLSLHQKKHTNTRALSGGMKRRLLIAKALVHKPKLAILDEPTAGVDVELRHNLWRYMRKLNKEGLTILLTTHYLEEAEGLCDRTAIINEGKLIAIDKTKKLIKSMGNYKKMTLSFINPITKIPDSLKPFNAFKKNEYELSFNFKPEDFSKIFSAMKELEPADIDLRGQNLEDVFMKLTNNKK